MKRVRLEVIKINSLWRVFIDSVWDSARQTQREAISAAVSLANELVAKGYTVTLKIKRPNGQIREERTYPRSSDPKRTKG